MLIDQEGGRVQRLRPPLARNWAPPLDQVAAAGADPAEAMRLRATLIAYELRGLGIDTNCIPTADIAGPETHPFLRNRCYGTDPARVAQIARATADGCLEGGVLPVVKHIPGHGRATVDSHLSVPRVKADRAALDAHDFAPFRALSDLPLGMTAHVIYEAVDDRPATVSPVMIRLIREEIGFDGLLMTDDLSMQALGGSIAERAGRAAAAGVDVVLHCNGDLTEMRAVAEAAGTMGSASARRGDRALSLRQAPAAIDIAATEARLAALSKGA